MLDYNTVAGADKFGNIAIVSPNIVGVFKNCWLNIIEGGGWGVGGWGLCRDLSLKNRSVNSLKTARHKISTSLITAMAETTILTVSFL